MKNCGKLINSWIELTCDHTYKFYEMDIYDAGFLKFVVCMLYFVNINIDISVSLFDYLFLILILVGLINSLEFQIIVSTDLFAESLFLTYRASGALDMD